MTYDQFNTWPLLLPRSLVREATGFSDDTISNLVGAGRLTHVTVTGSRKGRFRKHEVARLCGIQLDQWGRVVGLERTAA